jgi:hypothetical protein
MAAGTPLKTAKNLFKRFNPLISNGLRKFKRARGFFLKNRLTLSTFVDTVLQT